MVRDWQEGTRKAEGQLCVIKGCQEEIAQVTNYSSFSFRGISPLANAFTVFSTHVCVEY